jgi:hypothetical protein
VQEFSQQAVRSIPIPKAAMFCSQLDRLEPRPLPALFMEGIRCRFACFSLKIRELYPLSQNSLTLGDKGRRTIQEQMNVIRHDFHGKDFACRSVQSSRAQISL